MRKALGLIVAAAVLSTYIVGIPKAIQRHNQLLDSEIKLIQTQSKLDSVQNILDSIYRKHN